MKRREVKAPDVKYDPKVQVYGISLEEWDGMQKRLMAIEELLIANASVDIDGAPIKREPDPTAYDVVMTLQMLWKESTKFPALPIGTRDSDHAGTEFNFGSHRYTISVERY